MGTQAYAVSGMRERERETNFICLWDLEEGVAEVHKASAWLCSGGARQQQLLLMVHL